LDRLRKVKPFAALALIAIGLAGCEDNKKNASETAKKKCTYCLTDDFAGPNKGWPDVSDSNHYAKTARGKFLYSVKKPRLQALFGPDQFGANRKRLHFSDSTVSVTAAGNKGNPAFGVACRWDDRKTTVANAYVFGVAHRVYQVRAYRGDATNPKKLQVGPLPQGADLSRPTKLEASCIGTRLTFSVNGKKVASVHDSSIRTGSDGLYMGSISEPATAVFDNYEVR